MFSIEKKSKKSPPGVRVLPFFQSCLLHAFIGKTWVSYNSTKGVGCGNFSHTEFFFDEVKTNLQLRAKQTARLLPYDIK